MMRYGGEPAPFDAWKRDHTSSRAGALSIGPPGTH
jgi:hypothetical protein